MQTLSDDLQRVKNTTMEQVGEEPMEQVGEEMLQNKKISVSMILNFKQMVSSFESTRTLYPESDIICSYSINSGSVKTKDIFPIGEYCALFLNDIGVAFVATVQKNNSMTCYVWTKFVIFTNFNS